MSRTGHRKGVEGFSCSVGGPVVDHDDLPLDREIDGQQPVDDRSDGGAFVVDGNDDGQELGQRVGG